MTKNNYNAKQLKNVTILTPDTSIVGSSIVSLSDLTLENVIINSGTINNTVIGNLFPGPLNVSVGTIGNVTFNGNNISTNNNNPVIFSKFTNNGERLNMTTTFIKPSNDYNISMISITVPNMTLSGTLDAPIFDFFEKEIFIESLASNSVFQLNFPGSPNTLCSSEGLKDAQSILFTSPGQSIRLIYSAAASCWYIKNSGASIQLL